jgi:hypothetical protein
MLVDRISKETTDRSRVIVDMTWWLDQGEVITDIVSSKIVLGTTGWSEAPYGPPGSPLPFDPTPLEFAFTGVLVGGTSFETFVDYGTPGNVYTCQFVLDGTSERRVTLEVGVQIAGQPPAAPPYIPISSQPPGALPITGGTLTGPLYLYQDPLFATEAATKHYVDAGDAAATAVANAAVKRAGDTMSGLLLLSGDPVAPLGAATKAYVDSNLTLAVANKFLPLTGGTLSGNLVVASTTIAFGNPPGPQLYADGVGAALVFSADHFEWYFNRGSLRLSYFNNASTELVGIDHAGSMVVAGQLNAAQGVAYSSLNNYIWRSFADASGNLVTEYTGNGWYDVWEASDGKRIWHGPPNANLMTLDGAGNLIANATITSQNGRIIAERSDGNAPTITSWDTQHNVAAGMFVNSAGGLCFGPMDGSGNPGAASALFAVMDTDGHMLVPGGVSFTSNGSYEFTAYDDSSNNHIIQYRGGGWFDRWRSADGTREWSTNNGVMMTLDGNGSLVVQGIVVNNQLSATNLVASATVTGATVHSTGDVVADGAVHSAGPVSAGNDPNFALFMDGGGNRYVQFQGNYFFQFNTSNGQLVWNNGGSFGFQYTASNDTFEVHGTYALKPGGGPWAASSDARIKTVHGDYPVGLAELLRLNPCYYTYNADAPGKTYVGLVAQEVEAVLPDLVTQVPGQVGHTMVNDLRILDTGPLLFAVLNALKELDDRLRTLETNTTGDQHG